MFKYYDEIIKVGVLGEGRRGLGVKRQRGIYVLRRQLFSNQLGRRAPGPGSFSRLLSWATRARGGTGTLPAPEGSER